jgi:hypothetical protein
MRWPRGEEWIWWSLVAAIVFVVIVDMSLKGS